MADFFLPAPTPGNHWYVAFFWTWEFLGFVPKRNMEFSHFTCGSVRMLSVSTHPVGPAFRSAVIVHRNRPCHSPGPGISPHLVTDSEVTSGCDHIQWSQKTAVSSRATPWMGGRGAAGALHPIPGCWEGWRSQNGLLTSNQEALPAGRSSGVAGSCWPWLPCHGLSQEFY